MHCYRHQESHAIAAVFFVISSSHLHEGSLISGVLWSIGFVYLVPTVRAGDDRRSDSGPGERGGNVFLDREHDGQAADSDQAPLKKPSQGTASPPPSGSKCQEIRIALAILDPPDDGPSYESTARTRTCSGCWTRADAGH